MPKRSYLRSGFYAKDALTPARYTAVGTILAERRASLIDDLGGSEACSTAQLAMVDLVVASWAQLDSVTGYLLTLPSLVDKRHRCVWQVVRDRAALASQLQSLLRDIGLRRRAKEVRTLADLIAERQPEPGRPKSD